ncbi:ribosome biogenesis protein Rpf2p [Trichomonascus vanleenenianus]|uniref:rRNA-binding ribosome biosynthesis protein RPF2 n=1 Tax=Trichomonascus vanleenenianus TaxID=2268995 RepID=UPI003ECB8DF9
MLKTLKPKNARSKRALEKKEAKVIENVKQALFIPGRNCSQLANDAMIDLNALKKPDAKRFAKKKEKNAQNDFHPFESNSKEGENSLEFLSEKNDCSLLVYGTNNKKRPHHLTFVRTFDYHIYDMIELGLENVKLLKDFRKRTFQVGMKPMFTFNGPLFDTDETYMQIKSLFLDFFRGQVTDELDVAGLQHIISISAVEKDEENPAALPLVHFRVYLLKTYKSANGKLPRVELDEIGPRFDFRIGRVQKADPVMEKEASKKPKELEPKTKKNIETDLMGDQLARIHVGSQDLSRLQTRKMKGLKTKNDVKKDESGDEEEDGEVDELLEEVAEEITMPVKKRPKTRK